MLQLNIGADHLTVKRQSLIIASLLLASAFVGYVALGPGLYFWKEHAQHYESGARSSLLALHSMQLNYKQDHGEYASAFSQLGVPLGAKLDGDALSWGGPYRLRITQTVRNESGRVVEYSIEARPSPGFAEKYPILRIDEAGEIHQ
jgi:hypothetical protein